MYLGTTTIPIQDIFPIQDTIVLCTLPKFVEYHFPRYTNHQPPDQSEVDSNGDHVRKVQEGTKKRGENGGDYFVESAGRSSSGNGSILNNGGTNGAFFTVDHSGGVNANGPADKNDMGCVV